MKRHPLRILLIGLGLAFPCLVSASVVQSYNGSNGLGIFTLNATGDSSQSGSFTGESDVGNPSWGFYANSGKLSEALFNIGGGALTIGQTISFRMDNGNIQGGGAVGWGLQNIAGGNDRFEFFFNGGDTVYRYEDSTGTAVSSTLGHTSSGIDFGFTLTGTNSYSINVTPIGGSTKVISGSLAGTADSGIDRLRFFNFNAGSGDVSNLYFNSISVVPEPSGAAGLALGLLTALVWHRRRKN